MILVCAGVVFIGYKANQPMDIPGVSEGMTYVEFMQDRVDAAQTIEPSRCGWGMMLSLAKMTAPDPDIPKEVDGAKWYDVPGIWWEVVERLSWTMPGKPAMLDVSFISKYSPVN